MGRAKGNMAGPGELLEGKKNCSLEGRGMAEARREEWK